MTLEISTCEQREMILSWEFIEHLNIYSEIFSSGFFKGFIKSNNSG